MEYYSQDLGQLRSGKYAREAYASGVHFSESILPFSLSDIVSSSASVLETGSCFGQCTASFSPGELTLELDIRGWMCPKKG